MVGAKLSQYTTRKVIGLILVMLLAQPLMESITYQTPPASYYKGLELIYKLGGGSTEIGKK